MCFAPKPPTPQKRSAAPKRSDPAVQQARVSERQQAAAAGGRSGTILTKPTKRPGDEPRVGTTTLLGRSGS